MKTKKTKKTMNMVIAQSGGPSMVINGSLVAAVIFAKVDGKGRIGKILGARHGIAGILKGEYTDGQVEELQEAVSKSMKGAFNSIVINVMTEKTIDVTVYADPARFADSQEVYSQIRNLVKPLAETKKLNITKKLILMEIL